MIYAINHWLSLELVREGFSGPLCTSSPNPVYASFGPSFHFKISNQIKSQARCSTENKVYYWLDLIAPCVHLGARYMYNQNNNLRVADHVTRLPFLFNVEFFSYYTEWLLLPHIVVENHRREAHIMFSLCLTLSALLLIYVFCLDLFYSLCNFIKGSMTSWWRHRSSSIYTIEIIELSVEYTNMNSF